MTLHIQENKRICKQCGETYFVDQVNEDGVCAFCLVLRPHEKKAEPAAKKPARKR